MNHLDFFKKSIRIPHWFYYNTSSYRGCKIESCDSLEKLFVKYWHEKQWSQNSKSQIPLLIGKDLRICQKSRLMPFIRLSSKTYAQMLRKQNTTHAYELGHKTVLSVWCKQDSAITAKDDGEIGDCTGEIFEPIHEITI